MIHLRRCFLAITILSVLVVSFQHFLNFDEHSLKQFATRRHGISQDGPASSSSVDHNFHMPAIAASTIETISSTHSKIRKTERDNVVSTMDKTANPDNQNETIMALSYSLYGTSLKYRNGMIHVAQKIPAIFPGWQVWIYHDHSVPQDTLQQLSGMSNRHVKLINVETQLPAWVHAKVNPMAWRFFIASDPLVRAYAVRDGDSLPSLREFAAVQEWLQSRKAFHMLRDHPMHSPHSLAPMLGGMWGGLRRAVPNMDQLLYQHYVVGRAGNAAAFQYCEDQDFLWSYLIPLAYNDCLQHDSYYCRESNAIAFPAVEGDTPNRNQQPPVLFVGNPFAPRKEIPTKISRRVKEKQNIERYKTCLQDRQQLEEAFKQQGLDFATHVNTTFNGKMRGSSTESWAAWLATFNNGRQ